MFFPNLGVQTFRVSIASHEKSIDEREWLECIPIFGASLKRNYDHQVNRQIFVRWSSPLKRIQVYPFELMDNTETLPIQIHWIMIENTQNWFHVKLSNLIATRTVRFRTWQNWDLRCSRANNSLSYSAIGARLFSIELRKNPLNSVSRSHAESF